MKCSVGNGESMRLWSNWWVSDKPLSLKEGVAIPAYGVNSCVCDFILPNLEWDLNKLKDVLPAEIVDEVCGIPVAKVA